MYITLEVSRLQLEALARVVNDDPDATQGDDEAAAGVVKRLLNGLGRAEKQSTTSLPTYTIQAVETGLLLYEGPAKDYRDALNRMAVDQGFTDHADALVQSGKDTMSVRFVVRGQAIRVGRFDIPNDCVTAAEDRA